MVKLQIITTFADIFNKNQQIEHGMKRKRMYHSPEQWEETVGVLLMNLPQSQGEISDDPATEPAMAPGRDDVSSGETEVEESIWGNLW